MKSPVTQQQLTKTQHLDHSPPYELYSLVCLSALAVLTYYFSLSVCWLHINRLCLEIKFLALLPSRLCPEKLPPNHLFGLYFLHSTNVWKLLSILFIFY